MSTKPDIFVNNHVSLIRSLIATFRAGVNDQAWPHLWMWGLLLPHMVVQEKAGSRRLRYVVSVSDWSVAMLELEEVADELWHIVVDEPERVLPCEAVYALEFTLIRSSC